MKSTDTRLKGLRWYIDPGHGWLAVPTQALIDSGVAGQISTCSYINGQMTIAYLEEDCDAPLFLEAIGVPEIGALTAIPVEHIGDDGECFVRRLPPFVAAEVVGPQS